MSTNISIGLAGVGVVGEGVVKMLDERQDEINLRCNKNIVIKAVSAKNKEKRRSVNLSQFKWYDNAVEMASDNNIDVIVELIGGPDGPAFELAKSTIANKKSLVTANKAMLAMHGDELSNLAEKHNVSLNYEAAVAGGIPIVKTIRESLSGNKIEKVYGILNGTSNYILTEMEDASSSFKDVLSDAQKKGFAEQDPKNDIDGIDSAHKISILTSIAFGSMIDFKNVYIEGIRKIEPIDILYARELGYRIKLLSISTLNQGEIQQRVHPCMVPLQSSIAKVDGPYNAVVLEGKLIGKTFYEGLGAGQGPTASSVVSDLIDVAQGKILPPFGLAEKNRKKIKHITIERLESAYYLRLNVLDKPGVLADLSSILAKEGISIEKVIQRDFINNNCVSIVMLMHETKELNMINAINSIKQMTSVKGEPVIIRLEDV